MPEPITLNVEAREIVVARLEAEAPAMLQTIAGQLGITVEPIRKIYRAKEKATVHPHYLVTPPEGRIVNVGSGSVTAEVSLWAVATVSMQNPTSRDRVCEAHMAALLSVLIAGEPEGEGFAWQMEPVDFDTSPPGKEDNEQVQSVGVQVKVTIIQAR